MKMQVGEFLERHPEFAFDIVEHLEAAKYESELSRRIEQTRSWADESVTARSKHSRLDAALSDASRVTPSGRMMSKDDLRADISRYIDITLAQGLAWGKWTSGTTGPPILIPYAPEFYFDQLYLPLVRAAIFAGVDVTGESVFSIGLTDNPSASEFVLSEPTGTVALSLQVKVSESVEGSLDRFWKLVDQLRPSVISLKPVLLETLLRGPKPRDLSFLRFIFCSGSVLGAKLRREAEATFGRPILNGYGLTEFGIMGYECTQGSIHYDPSVFQVETVTAAGDPVGPNEPGIVAVTTHTNPLLPLWKYRTGDIAVAEKEHCACGRHGPRLSQLAGRIQSCFLGPQGELLSPVHFMALFDALPIREYQVIQEHPGSLRILVEPLSASTCCDIVAITRGELIKIIPDSWSITIEVTRLPSEAGFQRHQGYV
ncbi:AMP-binding protein [Streptomyces sp. NPDC041003]|uniref:AMP-binding protein n=1 Tax=Streptomyces sp. NPDC041003 TaxID=3155730 RepID=UPI003409410E